MHTLSTSEKIHYTNWWCRSIGIKSKDLEQHPSIDDVIILINVRKDLWNHMTQSNKVSWECFWDWCYTQKKPLRPKHFKKLENIAVNAYNTQKFKTLRLEEQRQKIKALKQNHTA